MTKDERIVELENAVADLYLIIHQSQGADRQPGILAWRRTCARGSSLSSPRKGSG